ncbi:GntR family transcriptional regulator [Nocardia amamiensis]|uniref:GntR family transcriptional regulator n=1 Tax=Nocardia amamiensis TaxID=404578 RepID=UPI0008321465|nr:GntR family transcriptional regulator [Nocardia amamiensis]
MPPRNPVWQKIADDLRRRLEHGEWLQGQTLPPMRTLAAEYEVSARPVHDAIEHLLFYGLVSTNPWSPRSGVKVTGQAAYMAGPAPQRMTRDLLLDTPKASGPDGSAETLVALNYTLGPASSDITEMLGLTSDQHVLRRTLTHRTRDDTPLRITTSYMSAATAAAAGLHKPSDETPGRTTTALLENAGITLHRTHIAIKARLPTPEEATQLQLAGPRLPILERRTTLHCADSQHAVEASTILQSADHITHEANIDLRGSG